MEFVLIFSIFIIIMALSIMVKNIKIISYINIIGSVINFIIVIYFINLFKHKDSVSYFNNLVYLDSLSIIQLFVIATVTLLSSLYSYKYILNELNERHISERRARMYYFLFNAFVMSMVLVGISNNVMAMWIGLEGTTIATAFLIGFNKDKLALEAAWKYIVICSIGLGIGLIGIILFIYSAGFGTLEVNLNWTSLLYSYESLNILYTKIAFTLIFVGIGTKVGFAPMHTWFSDGHSEAPSPVSAMVSGTLLNLAFYVIVRFYIIVKNVSGIENLKFLFIVFALISLIVASFSILKQTNYKRFLAFSSIENMGIIALGIGFGGYLGVFGAILHSIIHSFGKTLLFLTAGNILSALKTKRINKVHKLIKTMPKNAVFLVIGMLIITGSPPFASFFSEFNILIAGVQKGRYISIIVYSLCLILVLVGFLNIFIKMVLRSGEESQCEKIVKDNENILPLALSLVFVVFVTLTFNNYLYTILNKAVSIIGVS
ncbi:proton-conducting transporter membrane subunit [Clostridium sp. DJ247]|uniref:proton-conducting transporter transmembrane domain-containing protein n=1 Tax=Clostridium sp. DJ247 TaxID=2726188 RepID=UPI001627BE94|nr:proton-conducting transporter membrane subunit [Clostridium sp. DJ247]MBC2578739.1 hydrogenase 4 subunit F [Clostridium sp. DJ247]